MAQTKTESPAPTPSGDLCLPDNKPLQHTPGHRPPCPACLAKKAEKLDQANFGRLYFKQAAPLWLEERIKPKREIGEKQEELYNYYINKSLLPFFGELPLEEIHIGNIDVYIEERLAGNPDANGNPTRKIPKGDLVRKEVNCLQQIMDRAGLWNTIAPFYKPPKSTPSKVGKPLDLQQKEQILAVASTNKRWQVAYWGTVVMLHGVDGGELTALHVSDFDWNDRFIRIRDGLKTSHRDRIVALKEEGFWAMRQILGRYHSICRRHGITPDPEHYILPGRRKGVTGYDPTKRMGGWRSAWRSILEKAGGTDESGKRLWRIRRKDTRHDAITTMGEAGIDPRVISDQVGHADEKMQREVYFKARLEPLRKAANTLQIPLPIKLVETVDNLAAVPSNPAVTKEEEKTQNKA